MIRVQPPALRTCCAECGEAFVSTAEMVVVRGGYVHSYPCEGAPEPSAPLVLVAGLVGFFGGVLLLEALGWLRPAAVVIACVACICVAWEEYRRRAS